MSQVSSQITDAVTQSNTKVLGDAPAMSVGGLYQTSSHSIGLLFENSVNAQNQSAITAQAATTQGVMQIYSITSNSMSALAEEVIKPTTNTKTTTKK